MPYRTAGPPLNYSKLTVPPPTDYLLGPNDVLEVTIHGLFPRGPDRPVRAQVMANGVIHLPAVGPVSVTGMNLLQAQDAIKRATEKRILKDPRINVSLVERATTSVMVLGAVRQPGNYRLAKYENDVAHALAMEEARYDDAQELMDQETELEEKLAHSSISP